MSKLNIDFRFTPSEKLTEIVIDDKNYFVPTKYILSQLQIDQFCNLEKYFESLSK